MHAYELDTDFQTWMRHAQIEIEAVLDQVLPPSETTPKQLHLAMRYAVLGGGKRIRALLTFAAGEVVAAPKQQLNIVAAAIELIHAYSLVHDDLPCIDNDDLRRGKPTCHVAFSEATALLVGDALQSLAFQIMAEHPLCHDGALQLKMLQQLAQAVGSRGMVGGQAIDLEATGRSLSLPELENMHIYKTGALIRAAVTLGAQCGTCQNNQITALDRFAKWIGLAFQVVDDILDHESNTATLGKTTGKDAKQGKPTYVSTMGIVAAKGLADELRRDAIKALAELGEAAHRLTQLANFIVQRTF